MSERRARSERRIYLPVQDERLLIDQIVKAWSESFRRECADTHAQPRPFSPEPHQKSEDAAIALEHGKEIRNGE